MHRKNGSGNVFYFKQFEICHDRCAMKVGTDGVLLGAWANVDHARQILDIGTGTGLIALMLAQRSSQDVEIHAVEINIEAYEQAKGNINDSPWCKRVKLVHSSIQKFESGIKFDLIVCNPPYFVNSLQSPDHSRSQSRHASGLSFSELALSVKNLLAVSGRFCLILPFQEGKIFINEAAKVSLFCTQRVAVTSRSGKPIERLLLEFSNSIKNRIEKDLLLHDDIGVKTKEYQDLVSTFYIR